MGIGYWRHPCSVDPVGDMRTLEKPIAHLGELEFPKLDGREISPGIILMGEPTPIPGTNLMRCLANVGGALCVVELSLKFSDKAC